jgi:hypothetical protein
MSLDDKSFRTYSQQLKELMEMEHIVEKGTRKSLKLITKGAKELSSSFLSQSSKFQ